MALIKFGPGQAVLEFGNEGGHVWDMLVVIANKAAGWLEAYQPDFPVGQQMHTHPDKLANTYTSCLAS